MLLLWFIEAVFCTQILLSAKLNSQSNESEKSVIIIGGGVSGISSATTLLKAGGFSVTVLEADDHIGGRVSSRKIGDRSVEFGAEWVHGENGNKVFELMYPYGLFLSPEEAAEAQSKDIFHNIFATETGEEMSESFKEDMAKLYRFIQGEEDGDHDLFFAKTTAKFANRNPSESLGEFATLLFQSFNEKYPVHSRKTIQDAALDWIHRIMNADDAADNWFNTSHKSDGEQYKYTGGNNNVAWKWPASYFSLFKVLLGQPPNTTDEIRVPKWVELNHEVTEIRYLDSNKSEKVTVTCKNGKIYEADHVISTVSLGVLKEKHASLFSPDLSEKKALTIENLGFGTVNKILLEFENQWWLEMDSNFTGLNILWEDRNGYTKNANWYPNSTESDLLSEHDGLPAWCRSIAVIKLIYSNSHPRVLQAWISGVSARFMETRPMDYVTESVMKLIRKFLFNRFQNIPDPIRSNRSKWYSNPFTKGSYSHRTLASDKHDVWARDLATPILNENNVPIVGFAGEATHEIYFSTVHGAYETGLREANRILNFYKK